MRVAVLGAGGIGRGTAALLCREGHDPILWSPTGRSTRALAEGAPLIASGAISGAFRPRIAASCEEAMAGAECVIFTLPAHGHRAVMDAAAAHADASQTMIISSHYSLGALYLKMALERRGVDAPVVALGTTMLLSRPVGEAGVEILSVRAGVDIATLPGARSQAGLAACRALFGNRFHTRGNAIAIQLTNVNPQAHLANALCNLTRIENGESWNVYDGITPTVARLIEALDLERLAVARAFGVEVRTMAEHMNLSFDLPIVPLAEAAREVRRRGGAPGPASLGARWILEDFPFGIAPLVALARIAGVEVPLHSAGLALFTALLGRNLAAENDLLPSLELERRTVESLTLLAS